MARHYRSKYRPPGWRAARLVLVPLIAAILALVALVNHLTEDDRSWSPSTTTSVPRLEPNRQQASTTTPPRTTPATAPEIPAAASGSAGPAPVTITLPLRTLSPRTSPRASDPTTSPGSTRTEPSDLHGNQKISPRPDPLPGSIQGCQRSAAACFEAGGLGELADNLVVMKLDPVTGRFCFAFQPECSR